MKNYLKERFGSTTIRFNNFFSLVTWAFPFLMSWFKCNLHKFDWFCEDLAVNLIFIILQLNRNQIGTKAGYYTELQKVAFFSQFFPWFCTKSKMRVSPCGRIECIISSTYKNLNIVHMQDKQSQSFKRISV